jgi:predicted ATPase
LCHEIALQPLKEADVAEYLAADLESSTVPEVLAGLIYRCSEGNPLFMVEVLQHMRDRKLITQEEGKATLTLPLQEIDFCVPESLWQMIEIQLERLTSEERRALEGASVTGVSFSVVAGAVAANMDVNSFQNLCEGLSRRHQIVRSADVQEFRDGTVFNRYEFVHALYRDVLYQSQPPARRAKMHLVVGERLEALYVERLSEGLPS